jgi:hypothetical protein
VSFRDSGLQYPHWDRNTVPLTKFVPAVVLDENVKSVRNAKNAAVIRAAELLTKLFLNFIIVPISNFAWRVDVL